MSRDEGAADKGFEQFEQFLKEWSRRDFLRRTGGAAAYLAFMAGGAELLAACGPKPADSTSLTPVKGGKLIDPDEAFAQILDAAHERRRARLLSKKESPEAMKPGIPRLRLLLEQLPVALEQLLRRPGFFGRDADH